MSARNTLPEKRARRVRKAFRATPDAYIDLIAYVRQRSRCTAGMAEKVLLSGALKVDSHPVGFEWRKNDLTGKNEKVLKRYLPAKFAKDIEVVGLGKDK